MVTKRIPGAKKGRPKKTKTEVPKRAKGRPAKPLTSNPNRYMLAFAQALMDHHHRMATGISGNKVMETMVAIYYGRPEGTEENFDAMAQGEPFKVWADPRRGHIRNGGDINSKTAGEKWRDKNIFRPVTDNMGKRIRVWRKGTDNWLAAMSTIWAVCLQGYADLSDFAEWLAESIGEGEYFRTAMHPVLRVHAAARLDGFKGVQLPLDLLLHIFSPGRPAS